MSRKRTGQLIRTRQGYSARYTHPTELDAKGKPVRVTVPLWTDVKTLARARLARLVNGVDATPGAVETFEQAVERIATGDRLARLRKYALPILGSLPVTGICKTHVREALQAAIDAGRALNTCRHLRVDISRVLHALAQDELVSDAAVSAAKVDIPKGAKIDPRPRLILTDAEFGQFMSYVQTTDFELAAMAMCSRSVGGMRTSDLLAWRWEDIDLETWVSVRVPRPKTKGETRLELPEVVWGPLMTWWVAEGEPRAGPVFPCRTGKRAGDRRRGKRSFAKRLRSALEDAGITRVIADSAQARRIDFHSFRRQFATALAAAGTNVQQAMALAGHRVASTHMRYVQLTETLVTPEKALPAPFPSEPAQQPSQNQAPPARIELAANGLGKHPEGGTREKTRELVRKARAARSLQCRGVPGGAAFSGALWEPVLMAELRRRADVLASAQ